MSINRSFSSGFNFIFSDFDVDELLGDDSDDEESKLKSNSFPTQPKTNSDSHLINNYKKSIQYVGTDTFGDAVFVIYARDLPLDVKTNYQYFKVMDQLKDFFEKFVRHHLTGPKQKFVIIFITGLSAKENLPKVGVRFLKSILTEIICLVEMGRDSTKKFKLKRS